MGHRKQKPAQPVVGLLRGWAAIADYLKMPVATAQRWVKGGMPVRHEGRYTVANAEELRAWLGREAAMPQPTVIATNTADLATGLRKSIAEARKRRPKRAKTAV